MATSTSISDCLTELRTERHAVSARLDALDLAIMNLELVYGAAPKRPATKAKRAPVRKAPAAVGPVAVDDGTDASQRRAFVLALIAKAEVGLTGGEIRKHTPKMSAKERSNAIQILKARGEIRRTGNTWVKAA